MTHSQLTGAPLYQIIECPELMVDACLCDEQRSLIFLSIWGRDTAAQEFLARLTLSTKEHGLDHFHISTEEDLELPIFITNVNRLEKRSTRTFRRTLFGSMIHLWLVDKLCIQPDKANGNALAVLPKSCRNRDQRLWTLIRETCPLPLLAHWRDTVLKLLRDRAMLSSLSFCFGPVEGYRLSIDVPALTSALGGLIRSGEIGISPVDPHTAATLQRVA